MTAVPEGADAVFATEYLPGQFDQRADSAPPSASSSSARASGPTCSTARVYLLYGALSAEELADNQKIRHQPRGGPGGVPCGEGRR